MQKVYDDKQNGIVSVCDIRVGRCMMSQPKIDVRKELSPVFISL